MRHNVQPNRGWYNVGDWALHPWDLLAMKTCSLRRLVTFACIVMVQAMLARSAVAQAAKTAGKVTEAPKLLTSAELADGWTALFDGETLFGWKAHSKADWQVKG